jgi:glycosyltransferase involved in cell wall biosynthesis
LKLTIVTPSFNQAAFLEKTILSVLDQGWEELEYLVLDGGSTDGSAEILRRYDDRITWWVSEPDDGQTAAINRGIRRATGDVVAYINSDDYFLPGAFEAVMTTFARTGARWVIGASRVEDFEGAVEHTWVPRLPTKPRHWWLIDPWGYPQPSSFWRRDVFAEFGTFREDMHYIFDTEFGLRLLLAGVRPELTDRPLAVRVDHPQAKSADHAPFVAEQQRFYEIHGPSLTASERARMALWRRFIGSAAHRAIDRTSRATTHRMRQRLRSGRAQSQ